MITKSNTAALMVHLFAPIGDDEFQSLMSTLSIPQDVTNKWVEEHGKEHVIGNTILYQGRRVLNHKFGRFVKDEELCNALRAIGSREAMAEIVGKLKAEMDAKRKESSNDDISF